MKLIHPNTTQQAEQPISLLDRIGRLFRRNSQRREPVLVKVWDGARGQYREVDLLNRDDPLWSAAKSLAGVQQNLTRRSAA